MKILLASTATGNSFLAGIDHGYSRGFRELGHEVKSISHAQMNEVARGDERFDFFLLRDTFMVPVGATCAIADRCEKFAMFTHSEFRQAKKDARFIRDVSPDYIFLDQPLGGTTEFADLGIPMEFLGYGANHAARISMQKDIDIGFFGNGYAERQPRVEKYVFPLLDSGYNVKIHGRGQPDGSLDLDDMFEAMSRTKIVVNLCGVGARALGYGGRRILDAMASGCAVVADRFEADRDVYGKTGGCIFADTDMVGEIAIDLLDNRPGNLRAMQLRGYRYVRENWMISHVCEKMIQLVGL